MPLLMPPAALAAAGTGSQAVLGCPQSNRAAAAPARARAGRPPASRKRASPARSRGPEKKPRGRSSRFRGVTFYKRTGRWESHIWDTSCGTQLYLGGFSTEEEAARTYDTAALRLRGKEATLNFRESDYEEILRELKAFSFTPRDFARRLRKYGALLNRQNGTGKRSLPPLTEDAFQREKAALWAVFPPPASVGAEKLPTTEAPAGEAAGPSTSEGTVSEGTETPREAPPAPEEEPPPSTAKSLRAHPLGNFTPTHCI